VTTYGYTDAFTLELGLCVQLFALAEQGQEPLPLSRDADRLLFQIAARATKTFRAVMHLCVLGHGEQATMLDRSLFEDAITAHWIDANPDEAVERLAEEEKHTAILWRDHMASRGLDAGALADLPDLTPDEREKFERAFGARGDQPWTGLSIFRMVKAVEASWGDSNERFLLWHMHDVHLRYANKSIHVSSISVVKPKPTPMDADTLIYDSSPSVAGIPAALMCAFWAYANLIRLILPEDRRTLLIDHYLEGMPKFFRVHSNTSDR
jgi:hypothetical protein